MADALLAMRGITKRFPGVVALSRVDFELASGEIHALMGENGAGKSTLIKVLTGVHATDEGSILLGGVPIEPSSPADAVRMGISTVYQEVNLVPNLSVAENVCLGRARTVRWREMRERARRALGRIGVEIDVDRILGGCSIAIQQMVAIARALDVDARVLVLDEPTSSLDRDEVRELFEVLRGLRAQGIGIVFVTHFLEQVFELADRVTVLRNGELIATTRIEQITRLELVAQMLGRDASGLESERTARREPGRTLLCAEGLARTGSVAGVSLTVREGEVVGLAGLLGSGRTETVRLLFGIDAPDRGRLEIGGRERRRLSIRQAIRSGLGLCPEDRKTEGLLPDLSVRENMLLVVQARRGWLRRVPLKRQREIVEAFRKQLRIAVADVEKPIRNLSGGNQQKVMLARWLAADPSLLLLDEPTRGIDVGAKFEIASLIERLSSEGLAFVFVSSELEEVVRICGRVAVLRDRTMVGELAGDETDEEAIMAMIAGERA